MNEFTYTPRIKLNDHIMISFKRFVLGEHTFVQVVNKNYLDMGRSYDRGDGNCPKNGLHFVLFVCRRVT